MENGTSQSHPGPLKRKRQTSIPFVFRNRFLLLLIFLFILILIGPLLKNWLGCLLGDYTENFLFIVVLLAGLRSMYRSHALLFTAAIIAALCIALSICNLVIRSSTLEIAIFGVDAVFVALICAGILWHILKQKHVDGDTIMGGVCGYLLLGMLWAFLYPVLELLVPGSFASYSGTEAVLHPADIFAPLWYFSYATLTTLGFGDIVPVTETARGLTILEGIIGQIYLIVFVARLLGLHLAGRRFEWQRSSK